MFSKGICVFECAYMYIHVLVHMGVYERAKEKKSTTVKREQLIGAGLRGRINRTNGYCYLVKRRH